MLTGGVRGSAEARKAAKDMRKAAARTVTAEIRGALTSTVDRELRPLLVVSAAAVMPSGYNPVLSPALRVKSTVRTATSSRVGVFVTVFAQGRKEHRDVLALNRGILRHPLFADRKHWYAQRVRRGFVERAVTAVRSKVVKAVDDAASRVAEKIEKGTV